MEKPFEHLNQAEEPPKQEPMEEEEAHEMANMMRSNMGIFPETSRTITEREVRPEDFDRALEELGDLKRKAEEEPEVLAKTLYVLNKIAEMPLLGFAFGAALRDAAIGDGNFKENWDIEKYIAKTIAGSVFTDAEGRLRDMKTESGMYAGRELKHENERG
jgi:hypothetical protein